MYSNKHLLVKDIDDLVGKDWQVFFSKMEEIESVVKEINEIDKAIENKEPFEKKAIEITLASLSEIAERLIITEVLRSCVSSKEFNYEPYVAHLLGAINANINDIVEIKINGLNSIDVKVNFNPLGQIEQWASAIQEARDLLNLGKSRGAQKGTAKEKKNKKGEIIPPKPNIPGEPTSGELSSILWEYKIYKPGREGAGVKRWNRKLEDWVDRTEHYKGLYATTIDARLAQLPKNKAPYWNIIEHGNAVMTGGEGIPYPIVMPSNMVNLVSKYLNNKAKDLLSENRTRVENAFAENLQKTLGFKKWGGSWNEMKSIIGDEIERELQEGTIVIRGDIGEHSQFVRTYGDVNVYGFLKNGKTLQISARGRTGFIGTSTLRNIFK